MTQPGYTELEGALKPELDALCKASGSAAGMAALEQRAFESVRRGLDFSARLTKAGECKEEGNSHFAKQEWRAALVSYLAGIWFLQRGESPCPKVLVSESDSLEEVKAALGAGAPSSAIEQGGTAATEEAREDLRVTLHMNLAAAALKISEWVAARTASQYVLMVRGAKAPPKALFRLAKAHEGEENLEEAIPCLERLLASDTDNAEARSLLASLRKQAAAAAHSAASPKIEYLRKRHQAAAAAAAAEVVAAAEESAAAVIGREGSTGTAAPRAVPTPTLETMTGANFAQLSAIDQQAMVDAISRGLDEEASEETFDTSALKSALGGVGA
jgi:tetratricopeptide (TPR) repeat protein